MISLNNKIGDGYMKGFVADIERLTEENSDFRRVLYTGKHLQVVLMTIQPGEEIGEEVHEDRDQFFRIGKGEGEILIDGNRWCIQKFNSPSLHISSKSLNCR
jgi:mannose-6-phosphate isomerase-like protein (cupin superfamily)